MKNNSEVKCGSGKGSKRVSAFFVGAALVLGLMTANRAAAQAPAAPAPVNLGSAVEFAILAPAGFTNAGPSVVVGDVGTTGTSCTGFTQAPPCTFGPGQVGGEYHVNDPTAAKAEFDLLTAYNHTRGLAHGTGPFLLANSEDLGGKTLVPGLYTCHADLSIGAEEILRLIGNSHSIFIFQVGTLVAMKEHAKIVLVGGVKAANVYWQVGTAFTMAASANASGTIMASTGVTLADHATLDGRALTTGASVTLSTNDVLMP
jgi:hypothetical protein